MRPMSPLFRRLPHVILNVPTVLSLLLCVGASVLWALSYAGGGGEWKSSAAGTTRFAVSRGGRLHLATQATVPPESGGWEADTSQFGDVTLNHRRARVSDPVLLNYPQPGGGLLGVEWADRRKTFRSMRPTPLPAPISVSQRTVVIPFWLPCVLLALAPCAWPVGSVRRRRKEAGGGWTVVVCPACGYDLRATPGRCPECGCGRAAAEAVKR